MPATDIPDLADPLFAPIKAQLARCYLQHKDDLGVAYADDEAILQRVDDITWLLLDRMGKAFLARDEAWLVRYRWFTALVEDLLEDVPAKLDG